MSGLILKFPRKTNLVFSDFSSDQEAQPKELLRVVDERTRINFLTLNIGCLPSKGHQVNGHFLRPNRVRAQEIADQILRTEGDDQPDVISFQESFDSAVQADLIARLKLTYPYVLHQVGDRVLNAGSGLMIFSKYPIQDAEFHRYTNNMIGEETLANKGFLACKIQVSAIHFISVYNTHTQAGGGLFKRLQSWWSGTTSARRGVQLGRICQHMKEWEEMPPPHEQDATPLSHLSTHLTGDLNVKINDVRTMRSISVGGSTVNGFNTGDVKYPGQMALFQHVEQQVPVNFMDVYDPPQERGLGKKRNKDRFVEAQRRNFFTGSTVATAALQGNIAERAEVSYQGSSKLIDAMHATRPKLADGRLFSRFQSKIVSFQNSTDHFGVQGSLEFSASASRGEDTSTFQAVSPSSAPPVGATPGSSSQLKKILYYVASFALGFIVGAAAGAIVGGACSGGCGAIPGAVIGAFKGGAAGVALGSIAVGGGFALGASLPWMVTKIRNFMKDDPESRENTVKKSEPLRHA